jgi:hypothetical protein
MEGVLGEVSALPHSFRESSWMTLLLHSVFCSRVSAVESWEKCMHEEQLAKESYIMGSVCVHALE